MTITFSLAAILILILIMVFVPGWNIFMSLIILACIFILFVYLDE